MFCNIYLWFNLSAVSFFLCVFILHSVLLLVNSTLVIFVVPYEYSFCLLVKGINLLGWFPLWCTANLSHDLLLTFLFLSFFFLCFPSFLHLPTLSFPKLLATSHFLMLFYMDNIFLCGTADAIIENTCKIKCTRVIVAVGSWFVFYFFLVWKHVCWGKGIGRTIWQKEIRKEIVKRERERCSTNMKFPRRGIDVCWFSESVTQTSTLNLKHQNQPHGGELKLHLQLWRFLGLKWLQIFLLSLQKKNLMSYPHVHFCGLSFDLFVFWLNEDGEGWRNRTKKKRKKEKKCVFVILLMIGLFNLKEKVVCWSWRWWYCGRKKRTCFVDWSKQKEISYCKFIWW